MPGNGDDSDKAGGEIRPFSPLELVDGRPVTADGRIWRAVREIGTGDELRQGWVTQYGERGEILLARLAGKGANAGDEAGFPPIQPGDSARTLDWVRMRLTPGYVGKPAEDVVADIAPGVLLSATGGPQAVDGLRWWLLRPLSRPESAFVGWMAEFSPDGLRLLARDDGPRQPEKPRFRTGDAAETLAYVRLRISPGYVDKPDDDVIADIWPGTPVTIVRGPETADELAWWEVQAKTGTGEDVRGWMAEASPEGNPLLGVRTIAAPPVFATGDLAVVGAVPVRVRREPGYVNKADGDVLGEFYAAGLRVVQEGLNVEMICSGGVWVEFIAAGGEVRGWVAQTTPGGVLLLGLPVPLPGTEIPTPR